MAERPKRRLSVARKLIYSVVPVLVVLALVEVGFRLFAPRPEMPPEMFVEPDPDLIWRLKPMSAGVYRTNQLGLRDTEFRADADVKVLLLGDSVSWADGLFGQRRLGRGVCLLTPVDQGG